MAPRVFGARPRARSFTMRLAGVVVLALLAGGASAGPARAALDLVAVPVGPNAGDVWAGTVGDTLSGGLEFRVRDEAGRGVPDVPVTFTPAAVPGLARHRALLLSADRVRTDSTGVARVGVRLVGPPGDHLVVATIPGDGAAVAEVPVRILRRGWIAWILMGMAGGLALFLTGMRSVGRGLEQSAGGRMRGFLGTMTGNRFSSFLFGIVSTALVQSSSATTILLVGFVGAGLMTLGQSLGAVLGTAIGTTITVQIIAFRISEFALLVLAVGFSLRFTRRGERAGEALVGLGLLFLGLQVLSESMAPLRGLPQVTRLFVAAAEHPLPAVLAATLFTGIVQASAATIGIVLGLAFQGILGLDAALPFVLGANIGTTATALLASTESNAEGRRVAISHVFFHVVGVAVVFPLLPVFADVVRALGGDLARQIANAHTLLNVVTAALFLPLLPLVERGLRRFVPEPREEAVEFRPRFLEARYREQPSLAMAGAVQEVLRMGRYAITMLDDVKRAVRTDDAELARTIRRTDDRVDVLDEAITAFLADISAESLSEEQSHRVLDLLLVTKDLELIADVVSKGLVRGLLRKKRKYGLRFSDEGFRELLAFHDRVRDVVDLAVAAIATWDADLARQVLEKKREISLEERRLRVAHLQRLRAGNEESRATTTVHVDAVNDLKRIVTHAARIAYAILGEARTRDDDEDEDDVLSSD